MREIDLSKVFLVRPLARLPGGRTVAAVIIAALLLVAFWLSGAFGKSVDTQVGSVGAALFFSTFIAYIVPIFGYIVDRTSAALHQLRDVIDVDQEQFQRWQARLYCKPLSWLVWALLLGMASGAAHNLVLLGPLAGSGGLARWSSGAVAVAVGTQMTWIIVTLAMAALIDNARLINRAARHSRIEPFNPETLRPFATIALVSTLALIGAQAVFPILFVARELTAAAYLPGMLATGVPMLLLAVLPIWPVHKRIAVTKRRLLDDTNRRIAQLPVPDPDRPESIQALAPLLAYRREIRHISEWPFDVTVMARLALLLVIPPLTWVGAALVQHLVEAFL